MKWFYELNNRNLSREEETDVMRIKELAEYERYCTDYSLKKQQKELWFEDGRIVTTWFDGLFADYQKDHPTSLNDFGEPMPEDKKIRHIVNHRVNSTVVWKKDDRAMAELLCFLNFRAKIGWEWMDMLLSGSSIATIQRFLGHENIQTIEEYLDLGSEAMIHAAAEAEKSLKAHGIGSTWLRGI